MYRYFVDRFDEIRKDLRPTVSEVGEEPFTVSLDERVQQDRREQHGTVDGLDDLRVDVQHDESGADSSEEQDASKRVENVPATAEQADPADDRCGERGEQL